MIKKLLTTTVALAFALQVGAQTAPTNHMPDNDQGPANHDGLKAQIEAKRADLQKKIQAIKDAKKQAALQRIQNEIDRINKSRTDHYTAVTDQIEKVLNRITSRTDKAAAKGLDVSSVRTAIDAAKTAIAAARAAIATQAAKTYTLTITTQVKLRADVKATRDQIHSDLMKVQNLVKAARQAVQNAATMLAQLHGVDDDNATSTPANHQ